MKNYLITGASGCGKSTAREILSKKGFQTIDIDKGFADWIHKKTGVVKENPSENDPNWLAHYKWRLNAEKLRDRLRTSSKPLFVCGTTGDIAEYYPWFDKIFLLEYRSSDEIKKRLQERTNNPFGKNPEEVDNVLGWYEWFQENAKHHGAIAIDCILPQEVIVNTILKEIDDDTGTR